MIETKEKIIDGSKYTVTQMTARKALRMKTNLIKLFGTSLAEIFLPTNGHEQQGYSKDDTIKAIQKLTMQLDESVIEKTILNLLQGVRKEGVELTESIVDLEYAGKLDILYQVIWFVLEVNFSSFFELCGIGNLLIPQEIKQKKQSK